MIKIDVKKIKLYEADLKQFKQSAYPFATKQTINQAARNTAKVAGDMVRGKMILRNNWTAKSIQWDRAAGSKVENQRAVVGSVQSYMYDQEFGTTKRPKRGNSVPIATPTASGEDSIPRRKLPRRANSLAAIQLRRSGLGKATTRAQRNRIAVSMAGRNNSNRFVYLDLGRRSGIYRVSGGKRKPRLDKVWDMGRPSVLIPATPWLRPAVDAIQPRMPTYYAAALLAQLKRHGILGY